MKFPEWVKRVFGIAAILSGLFLAWLIAPYISSWFYGLIDFKPSSYALRQMIDSFLGFFIFGISMYTIAKVGRIEERQQRFLHPFLNAMKMMAEGNFNIDLSYYKNHVNSPRHPYYKIIESINHTAEQLGEMEQMRQEFISNVSHEIQSPLTSISGFAHALKNNQLSSEEKHHYLTIIETECQRLSKLSENLLKLTSLESDHPFEKARYRLDRQLRQVILSCEPQWTKKHIDLDVRLENITVNADEELMNQVWINLIHNSIKFTPEHGIIKVQLQEKEDVIEVSIKDSGIGMNMEEVTHMFERFYKADRSRNRNIEGNGLGLSIVRKILDLHDARVQVKSEPSQGTEVIIKLAKE
ncbi:HAMP domain-containing sensor histidine kinase [Pullulanibacillus sp. KACC 23026]|uniref:sensor histidine kinase n=1 Tax=Pullulanibacillus sp. KACC 23026 TaxID=3028315 RepID=UPI0023AEBDC0|nr:HAMP domain-containing sensor histidine kinase [Pullulanibacillus sp. KACC 23026]WEG14777.1 HAMP domain-containing sensor histidine kinase [Pullulanibacillus sp. KACC 23026]